MAYTTANCFSTTAEAFCAARWRFIRRKPLGNGAYEILVPKVDADGNDIAGIRLPAIEVPVGTYTGWNLRPRGLAEGELSGLLGSFIPFAKTKVATRQRPAIRACRWKNAIEDQSRLRSASQPRCENLSRAKIFVAGRRRENYRRGVESKNIRREKIAGNLKMRARSADAAQNLCEHPRMGRPGHVDGTREWIVKDSPYLIVCRVRDEDVEILRMWHGRQNWQVR